MTTIVHRTPGLLDTRSFTVMGMSAKPGTGHPIGQFGTGLKYSIAGLLRSGAQVSIWIGRQHWQFETATEDFRGATFTRIYAWVRDWGGLRRRRVELPFTTSLGPNWTWWMWLRELHSNTLDEQGDTDAYNEMETKGMVFWEADEHLVEPDDNTTLIVVTHPEYSTAWEARGDVFLPGGHGPEAAGSAELQCLPEESTHIYYRSVRVLDLRSPTLATYNILRETPLTEDRTMQEWYARHALAFWLVSRCTDQELIRAILEADDKHWEHDLELPHHIRPSADFEAAARRVHRMGGRLTSYVTSWSPPPPPDTRSFWQRRGRRWQLAETQILDERGRPVLTQPESLSAEDWRDLSEAIVLAVRPVAHGDCPTCHQTIPTGPPPRPAVVGDLYAGLDHDWSDDPDMNGDFHCLRCGETMDREGDNRWDPCNGPAWMQSEMPIKDAVEAAIPEVELLYEPVQIDRFADDVPF